MKVTKPPTSAALRRLAQRDAARAALQSSADELLAKSRAATEPHLRKAFAVAAKAVLDTAPPRRHMGGYPRLFAVQMLVVEGATRFPLEMADRDVCAPASETDALRMYAHGPRRIALRRFVRSGRCEPHTLRWRSFGWRVVWYGTWEDFQLKVHELGVKQ